MKLDNVSLLDIIPSNMRGDKTIKGFAAAWDWLQGQVLKAVPLANLFENLDKLTSEQLDSIAKAEDVPWYDTSFDIAKRRRILRDYKQVYYKSGTVWAIETAMGNIFGEAVVKEWYDYGGSPFHFKVLVVEVESEEKVRMAIRTIDRIRPARTTLDGIEKLTELSGVLTAGCFIYQSFREVRHPAPRLEV